MPQSSQSIIKSIDFAIIGLNNRLHSEMFPLWLKTLSRNDSRWNGLASFRVETIIPWKWLLHKAVSLAGIRGSEKSLTGHRHHFWICALGELLWCCNWLINKWLRNWKKACPLFMHCYFPPPSRFVCVTTLTGSGSRVQSFSLTFLVTCSGDLEQQIKRLWKQV